RKQRVLQEVEFTEIEGVPDPDGGAVIAVAPGDVVAILQPDNSRVVAVLEAADLRVGALPFDRLRIQLPGDAVLAEAPVQVHDPFFIVAAEDAREMALPGHHRAVEDAV